MEVAILPRGVVVITQEEGGFMALPSLGRLLCMEKRFKYTMLAALGLEEMLALKNTKCHE